MKSAILWLFICFAFFSCKKEDNPVHDCYKGRFIENGCWPVIELLEPLNKHLPTGQYRNIQHTIGAGNLPEQYKNGKPFYFTINHIDSNLIYVTSC